MIATELPETPVDLPAPIGNEERPQEYVADVSFDDLGLSPELRRAVMARGYTHPTPVQARAYAPVMAGRDLIVRSKTGTGKTAAFGMPIIDSIPMGTREVKALVLCPTRELALQVAQEIADLAKFRDIQVTAIYGGASMKQQEDALDAGSAIIVGTPGRVYDHIRRGNLKLGTGAHAVLDEADEMLNQGFYEEVTRILDCLPTTRQVLLFSATVPEDIQRLIAKYTTNAETLLLSGDVYTVEHIHHVRYDVSDAYPKPRNLLYLLEMEEPENAIIFCNTRDDTELVTAVLNRNGLDAELLNGDLPQKERERVMAKVKRGEVAYMVATDIAARGIDISDLSHVINYSLPEDPAVYLHRVGRTGRIGRKGTALNLTTGRELMTLTALEKKYGVRFEKRAMPTAEAATAMWTERHVRELKSAAQDSIYEGYLGLAEQLKARPDADELIAFMLRSFFSHLRMDRVRASGGTEEPPAGREERISRSSGRGGASTRDRGGPRGEDRSRPPRRDERGSRGERPRREGARTVVVASPADGTSPVPVPGPEHNVEARPERAGAPEPGSVSVPPAARPAEHRPSARAPGKVASDRELFEQLQRSGGVSNPPVESRSAPSAASGTNTTPQRTARLTDRALFEAIQAGAPLPPTEPEAPAPEAAEPEASQLEPARPARPREDGPRRHDEVRATRARAEGAGEGRRDRLRERRPRGPREARPAAHAREEGAPRVGEVASTRDPAADRALLEALQTGQPLPPIEDPTVGTGPAPEGEGGDKRRRARRPELAPLEPGETRLWLNLGRADGLDLSSLQTALEAAGAPAAKLRRTELRGTFSYLIVAEPDVAAFEAVEGKTHQEKSIKLERARR
jgi:ATP-dependent RNA helicase DeaD